MKKKKRRRIKKSGIILLIILGIIVFFISKSLVSNDGSIESIELADTIEEYNYVLDNNETKYYKELFKELKKVLSKEKVNEEMYAKLISQLFVADFFTLDNKIDKNDIGGTQFVYAGFESDFEKLAKTSIYKNIENNMYNNRKQDLPIVVNTEISSVDKINYEYLDTEDNNAYEIVIDVEYKKDLKYQDECTLILVHINNKLEIVKMY